MTNKQLTYGETSSKVHKQTPLRKPEVRSQGGNPEGKIPKLEFTNKVKVCFGKSQITFLIFELKALQNAMKK